MQGRRISRSIGVAATFGRVSRFSSVDPDFPRFNGDRANGWSREAAMEDQLGQAPLESPPTPAFGTGAAANRSRCLAPPNVRSDGMTRLCFVGALVPTPTSAGRRGLLMMALGAAGTAFPLVAVCRDLLDILMKNGGPRPE